jgi:ATP-dependent Lhr-like helicase
VVARTSSSLEWWTFAGLLANASLRVALGDLGKPVVRGENLEIPLRESSQTIDIEQRIAACRGTPPPPAPVAAEAIEGLKFSRCLPRALAVKCLEARLTDAPGFGVVTSEAVRFVRLP